MRPIQPIRATQLKIQASCACSGTWDLVDEDGFFRVDAGGDEARAQLARVVAERVGVEQLCRDRVQVDHAIDGLEPAFVLHVDPPLHRAEVIAECQAARGLHARKDAGGECRLAHVLPSGRST
jgi:hypothetical protein